MCGPMCVSGFSEDTGLLLLVSAPGVAEAHWIGATRSCFGRMGSGVSGLPSGWCRRDRASVFRFLVPGRYEIVKLNLVKKSAHLACRGFSLWRLGGIPGSDGL